MVELNRQSQCLAVANFLRQVEDRHMVFVDFRGDAPTRAVVAINRSSDVPDPPG